MIKEVYKNYYLDFVMFNYTIDEFLEAAVDDYGDVSGSGVAHGLNVKAKNFDPVKNTIENGPESNFTLDFYPGRKTSKNSPAKKEVNLPAAI